MSNPEAQDHPQVLVVGPDGVAVSASPQDNGEHERPVTEMVEQPAKVMRVGSMIRQLLEEVRAAPLDEKSRARLKEIHSSSIKELEDGLAPELVNELERLSLPFDEAEGPRCRARPSYGSPRPSWSAGLRACSTASRPRCSPSRWRPGPSSSRCAGHSRPACCRPSRTARNYSARAPAPTCSSSASVVGHPSPHPPHKNHWPLPTAPWTGSVPHKPRPLGPGAHKPRHRPDRPGPRTPARSG